MLTATFNSYGDRQISTPHKINPPEPIDKKFGTIDYVREGTSYTKFGRNPFTGGFWTNYFFLFFYLYLFFFDQATGQTRGWIFTRNCSETGWQPVSTPKCSETVCCFLFSAPPASSTACCSSPHPAHGDKTSVVVSKQ